MGMICIQQYKTVICFERNPDAGFFNYPDLFHTQHIWYTLQVGYTFDRRARFSSSSSLSLSCKTSSCNRSCDTLKDSLKRSGVEQLESVSLSSEAIETIRSRSSFFESSCCSWLTYDKRTSPAHEIYFSYTTLQCIICAASWNTTA